MTGDLNVCDDGLEVWASVHGDGAPRVRFGTDAEMRVPQSSVGISACRVGSSYVLMLRGHEDRAFKITRAGVITDLGAVVGTNCVGVIPNGDLYWINAFPTYRVNDGVFPVPKDAGGQYVSPQGWTQIFDRVPVWTDLDGTKTIDGRTLTRCVTLGAWTIGMDTAYPRIVAFNGSWWLVANTDTQTGPQAVIGLDGRLRVALSGNNCRVVSESHFEPLTDPVIIPTFPKTSLKIGIGLFDDLDGPRIQDFSEVVSDNTRAIFWQIGTQGQTKSKALAKSLDVGSEAYLDTYGIKPEQVPPGFRALVFAYPTETMDVATSLGRVEIALDHLKRSNIPCDLAVAMYCQFRSPGNYALPLQKVMDMLAGVWRLGLDYKVGALWGFTKRRMRNGTVVDGVEYWPELQICYDRLKTASGDWQHFPPYATAPPPETFWAPLGDL